MAIKRAQTMRLNSGRVIPCIDTKETPPPPEGYLRCDICGRIKQIIIDQPYDFQENCGECGVDGQTMMGRNWAGWNTSNSKI